MKVVEFLPSVPPDVNEYEWEDSRGDQISSEEAVMMSTFRVTVMEGDVSVQSDFLVPEAHPIDMVLESRSWMDDVSSAGRTDDDEMRREMERLAYGEKELRREIQEAAELHEKVIMKSGRDRSTKIDMRKIDVAMIERDARDSVNSSQPSDEACDGGEESSEREISEDPLLHSIGMPLQTHHQTEECDIEDTLRIHQEENHDMNVRGIDPPEGSSECLTSSHQRTEECLEEISADAKVDTDDYRSTYDDPSLTLSGIAAQESVGQERIEMQSNDEGFGNITNEYDEEREDAPSSMSDWAVKFALQMPDLERGRSPQDLFEEEFFWEDGFWKSSWHSRETGKADTSMLKKQKRTQVGDVCITSVPSEDNNKKEFKLNIIPEKNDGVSAQNQSSSKASQGSNDSSLDDSSSEEGWTDEWNPSSPSSERDVEELSFSVDQTIYDEHRIVGGLQSTNETEDNVMPDDNQDNKVWCTFRRTVLIIAVHLSLIVIGFITLAQFIKINGDPRYNEAPSDNSACEKSTTILFPSANGHISISGRLDPSTASDSSLIGCDFVADVGVGAWYSLLGNGKYITLSICDGSMGALETHLRLFSGPCSNLECVADHTDPSSPIEPISSISWLSKQDETYFILVSSLVAENEIDFELCLDQSETGGTCEASIRASFFTTDDGSIDINGNIEEVETGRSFVSNETGLASVSCNGGSMMSTSLKWYSIVGTGNPIIASTCKDIGESFSAIFEVMSGSCDGLECINNGTTISCGSTGQQYLQWDTVLGLVYWIVVSGDKPGSYGGFSLNILSAVSVGEQDDQNVNLPVTTVDESPTSSIWFYAMLVGIFAAFALIAWRWRRLKQIFG
jgi:hypothetical protein